MLYFIYKLYYDLIYTSIMYIFINITFLYISAYVLPVKINIKITKIALFNKVIKK